LRRQLHEQQHRVEKAPPISPELLQGQVATVIQSLEWDCEFKPDPEQYIIEISEHVTACEHVEGWGWSLFWYREGDVIFVQAAPSVRVTLKPKHPVK
jgi:hypothetical protein